MAAPARYWRIVFRSVNTYNYAQLGIAHLRLFDVNGNELTAAPNAPILSTALNNSLVNSTGFPLENLIDGDEQTICAFNWPSYRTTTSWRAIDFDFGEGNAVLVDYVLARVTDDNYNGNSILPANSLDWQVQSSDDNSTWMTQCLQYRPLQQANTDYRFAAAVTSDLYPIPSRDLLGGDGGIYGIVSEDGVAMPNRPVMLFERETFYKIAYTTTDENGGYAFNGLNRNNEYLVMSVDPSGPPYKNAIVWDRIKPINTKGNLGPQSPFWARRIRDKNLGSVVCFADFLDSVTYDFFRGNVLGSERLYSKYHSVFAGYDFANETALGGAMRLLKSNRTETDLGNGLTLFPGLGTFSGVNNASMPDNYANLTFEYIFQAPQATESALIFVWAGRRDSDDATMYGYDGYYGEHMRATGPTLEVNITEMNVRFPLSARNRATPRVTAPVVAGTPYHVMIAYTENASIQLYVNGALAGEADITGAGRLWGHTQGRKNFEDWDNSVRVSSGYYKEAAIRRLDMLYIGGNGYGYKSSSDERYNLPPGYGGAVGLAAIYGRTFTASDVQQFYDSYNNWDTHAVVPEQSGYMAEVEADNPSFYARLNNLMPPQRIETLLGHRDYRGSYGAGTVFNAAPFVSGSPSITTSDGGVFFERVDIAATFTVEFFVRFSSTAGTQRLFLTRKYNSSAFIYLSMIDGTLSLSINDRSGTTTTQPFPVTLNPNTDYHLVVQYDPWELKTTQLFINGAQTAELPASAIPNTIDVDWLGVGVNVSSTGPSYSERVQGDMAEFAIYNYILPPERIAAHYAARNA